MMKRQAPRVAGWVLILWLGGIEWWCSPASAQQSSLSAAFPTIEMSAAQVDTLSAVNPHATSIGVKECAACHTQPGLIYPQLGVTRFVRLTEATQWFSQDKHAVAYELVRIDLPEAVRREPSHRSNQLAKEMVDALGWQPEDGNFQRQCLTCHAGYEQTDHRNLNTDASRIPIGVECEDCHGPGSLYTERSQHQQPSWRTKGPLEKAELGLIDLANPALCAEVCLSCHLGNLRQDRFVTHAMYAAGHPVLPPFELQTFLDAMPPHWADLKSKPLVDKENEPTVAATFQHQKDVYLAKFDLDATRSESELKQQIMQAYDRSQRSRIGTELTSAVGIAMIFDAAEQDERWGDFALYDCMGCHQILSQERPRYRVEGRIPGRAFPPLWWSVDATATTESTENTDAIFRGRADLRGRIDQAFNRIPFGDRQAVQEMAREGRLQLANERLAYVAEGRQILSAEKLRSDLKRLFEDRRERLTDYWVARQTAWTMTIAARELIAHGELQSEACETILTELDQLLRLNLRIPQRQSVLGHHVETLEIANQLDADRCRGLLEKILQLALHGPASRQ